jgi:hypothetical protein
MQMGMGPKIFFSLDWADHLVPILSAGICSLVVPKRKGKTCALTADAVLLLRLGCAGLADAHDTTSSAGRVDEWNEWLAG